MMRQQPGHVLRQRGMSLVELMVGITIGLFVVAGAAVLVSTQLSDNRRLLLETQVQQDLRATADIVTRELRRAGYWNLASNAVWVTGGSPPVGANPQTALSISGGSVGTVTYDYYRSVAEQKFGFKLEGGILKTLLASGGWQELSDVNTLRVTAFTVTPVAVGAPAVLPCPNLCPGGGTACWPTLTVRELVVNIAGEAVSDPAVKRNVSTTVRLRNDQVTFNSPPLMPSGPNEVCPP